MYYLVVGIDNDGSSDIMKIWFDESSAITHAKSLIEEHTKNYHYELSQVLVFDNNGEYWYTNYYRREVFL